jgi:hypothetical protein
MSEHECMSEIDLPESTAAINSPETDGDDIEVCATCPVVPEPCKATDTTDITDVADKLVTTTEMTIGTFPEILIDDVLDATETFALPGGDITEDGRPIVYLRPGHLREAIAEAEQHLALTGTYFQQDGSIVKVSTDPACVGAAVQVLNPLALVHALDGVSAWMKFDKRSNAFNQIDPPERICKLIANITEHGPMPVLRGVTKQPYLRPNGTVMLHPGYDAETGIFGVFDSRAFDVVDSPSRADAEDALGLLQGLLSEFPFVSENDRSAALAAMLTATIRATLPLAPMFHVRAHQISSGKSYLCALIAAFATAQPGCPVAFPRNNEECTKLLIAELGSSPAVVEFDNLTSDLIAHESLNIALTSGRIKGRLLQYSKTATVGTQALFLSSGNNVGPVADMTRRCVTINLEPDCEVPAARSFSKPDLIADVRRERGRYVSAALTIVRAWLVAGSPMTPCNPVASYGEWTRLCCQPLLWLNQPDPAASVFVGMAEDPEREILGKLIAGWYEQFGEAAKLVRDVVGRSGTLCPAAEDFHETLLEITGERDRVNPRKLGQWFKKRAGQVVNGKRLVKAPKTRNAESWRVESVVSVKSVPASPLADIGIAD